MAREGNERHSRRRERKAGCGATTTTEQHYCVALYCAVTVLAAMTIVLTHPKEVLALVAPLALWPLASGLASLGRLLPPSSLGSRSALCPRIPVHLIITLKLVTPSNRPCAPCTPCTQLHPIGRLKSLILGSHAFPHTHPRPWRHPCTVNSRSLAWARVPPHGRLSASHSPA